MGEHIGISGLMENPVVEVGNSGVPLSPPRKVLGIENQILKFWPLYVFCELVYSLVNRLTLLNKIICLDDCL